ncbi:Fib_succ_major, fibrobacter succinogenes major paralogous domain [Flavobacteriaceae bacterium]
MKKFYLFLTILFCFTSACLVQAQNDSIYLWKSGQLTFRQSIKTTDLDSITFKIKFPTVQICSQVWTKSNLNLDVATYSDGTPIPQVTDANTWNNSRTGMWCYYNNNVGPTGVVGAYGAVYGKLYNWYAVAGIYDLASLNNASLRKKLAPIGWHIPTDAEWTILTTCLGGEIGAGIKMKEAGTSHWSSQSGPYVGNNSSGFTALPSNPVEATKAEFWSTDEYSVINAWTRVLYATSANVTRNNSCTKNSKCSVRCIKD